MYKMKILSVSTATNHLSVALNDGQQIIVEKNERDERNQVFRQLLII